MQIILVVLLSIDSEQVLGFSAKTYLSHRTAYQSFSREIKIMTQCFPIKRRSYYAGVNSPSQIVFASIILIIFYHFPLPPYFDATLLMCFVVKIKSKSKCKSFHIDPTYRLLWNVRLYRQFRRAILHLEEWERNPALN